MALKEDTKVALANMYLKQIVSGRVNSVQNSKLFL